MSYLAVLVTTADTDDRVVPGHSAGTPTSKLIEDYADRRALPVENLDVELPDGYGQSSDWRAPLRGAPPRPSRCPARPSIAQSFRYSVRDAGLCPAPYQTGAAAMNERQEPIPGWAKPLLWVNDNLIFDAPGKPVCQIRWGVNFHKIFTLFLIFGMMVYTQNFSDGAWVFLALHGIYGYCWLIKDYAFRDLQFEKKISVLGVVNMYILLIAWYWLAPWLFLSRHVVLSGPELFLAIAIHTLGVVVMVSGDGQRHWVMKYHKGLMNFGMYRYTRNPNYLGEIMLYFAYAFMARHWLSWLVFAFMTVYFLARMTRKDQSISRYPGWAAYKEQSGLVIPWALLNGRAWKDLFGKQGPESDADAGPSGLGGQAP